MSLSADWEKVVLDLNFGATTKGVTNAGIAVPATIYIALVTVAITNGMTGSTITETAYGSYARVALTNNATNWPNATGSAPASKSNGVEILFPESTSGTTTIVGACALDAASAGRIIAYGALAVNRTFGTGITPRFPIGTFIITAT